jgi:signal peptidase I
MTTADHSTEQPTTINHQRGLARRVLETWRNLNDWLKALLIAFVVLGFTHAFILRWVTVRSTSMYGTLYPGDLVGVAKWPLWTGFGRGDIVVFRDPLQDDRAMARRQLLVKRIVGLPGDVVELRNGELLVNNVAVVPAAHETRSWLVRLTHGTDAHALISGFGLPVGSLPSDAEEVELPLNDTMAAALRDRADVVSVEPMRSASGHPGHIFPYSPSYKWNSDDYGPIIVPRKGDQVRVDLRTLPLYDRIITRYEGNDLDVVKRTLSINGQEAKTYLIQQDYYFVLGDSRHYSADSRYWGFVPADHLTGRAAFVLMGNDANTGEVRGDRWFLGLH